MGGYFFGGLRKMAKQSYKKPALTLDQQVQQLIDRGMIIDDRSKTKHYLGQLNYYRLGAYWLPFQADRVNHKFQPDTRFDRVLELYIFDRELRLMIMDAIERVEVAIRTQFAYQLSLKYGPHPHLNRDLFKEPRNGWEYRSHRRNLEQETRQNREAFIQHLLSKYSEPLPPIWAIVEIMTLGQLSRWYANLKNGADRNLIAHQYDFDEINLVSFLHHLSTVRNFCAHHSRLWNREFTFTFKLPSKRPECVVSEFVRNAPHSRKIYNSMVMLAYFLDIISPGHHWKQRFRNLTAQHNIDVAAMGFPKSWRKSSIWAG